MCVDVLAHLHENYKLSWAFFVTIKKNLSLINHKYSSFVEGEKTLSGSMLLVCDWCSSFLEL